MKCTVYMLRDAMQQHLWMTNLRYHHPLTRCHQCSAARTIKSYQPVSQQQQQQQYQRVYHSRTGDRPIRETRTWGQRHNFTLKGLHCTVYFRQLRPNNKERGYYSAHSDLMHKHLQCFQRQPIPTDWRHQHLPCHLIIQKTQDADFCCSLICEAIAKTMLNKTLHHHHHYYYYHRVMFVNGVTRGATTCSSCYMISQQTSIVVNQPSIK